MSERFNHTLPTGSFEFISFKRAYLEHRLNGSINLKEPIFTHGRTWLLPSTNNTNTMLTLYQLACNYRVWLWARTEALRSMLKNGGIWLEGCNPFWLTESWWTCSWRTAMSKGSGTLRLPVEVTTGAVTKTLGLAFSDGTAALGAVEPDAMV